MQTKKASDYRIALLPLRAGTEITQAEKEAIENAVLDRLVAEASWDIVERKRLSALQKELAFQQSGLLDSKTVGRIGRLLAANKLLASELQRVRGRFILHLRLIDTSRGRVDYSVQSSFSASASVAEEAHELADALVRKMTGRPDRRSYYTGLVPGWTQFARGQELWGWGFSLGGLAFTALHVGFVRDYRDALSKQQDLLVPYMIATNAPSANLAILYNDLYLSQLKQEVTRTAKQVNVSGMSVVALFVANYIHALWFAPAVRKDTATALAPESGWVLGLGPQGRISSNSAVANRGMVVTWKYSIFF